MQAYLDTSVTPVALWNFDEGDGITFSDSSGNGYDLSVISGAVLWTDPIPGVRGVVLNRAPTIIGRTTGDLSGLRITGDLTVEMILYLTGADGVDFYLTQGGGETNEATNTLYQIRINDGSGSGLAPRLSYHSTTGAGVTAQNFDDTSRMAGTGIFAHIALVRSASQVTFYMNGQVHAGPSVGLTGPTGGTSSTFRLNGYSGVTNNSNYAVTSIRICNYAFTAGQVETAYNSTVGAKYPRAVAPP